MRSRMKHTLLIVLSILAVVTFMTLYTNAELPKSGDES